MMLVLLVFVMLIISALQPELLYDIRLFLDLFFPPVVVLFFEVPCVV